MGDHSVMGCTVGVVYLPWGMLVFKNRDLPKRCTDQHTYILRSTPETHALMGVNLQNDQPEGVSIGVNRHRICVANTHVFTTPDMSYDCLCAALLQEANSKRAVLRITERFVKAHALQGGRILVCAPGWALLIEVLGRRYACREQAGNLVLTNHFSLIRQRAAGIPPPGESSLTRFCTATEGLRSITRLGELKSLLRSHLPEKGKTSICNHGPAGGTESSHIIQISGATISWSSLIGHPCEQDYHTTVPLPPR